MIAPDNTLQFSERVHELLVNPLHRFELGKQAKTYALEKWTAKLQAERMIQFYEEIIKSKSSCQLNANNQLANMDRETSHLNASF